MLLHFQNQVTPCIVSNLLICSSACICYFNNDKGRIVMGIDCSREINKKERIRFSGSLLKTRFLFGDFFLFSYFQLQLPKLHVKLQLSFVFYCHFCPFIIDIIYYYHYHYYFYYYHYWFVSWKNSNEFITFFSKRDRSSVVLWHFFCCSYIFIAKRFGYILGETMLNITWLIKDQKF